MTTENIQRYQLNANQIGGLALFVLGDILQFFSTYSFGPLLQGFGILVFLVSATFNYLFIVSCSGFLVYFLLKIQHLPYANIFYFCSLIGFSVASFKQIVSPYYTLRRYLLYVFFILFLLGVSMKLFHVMGEGYFLSIGAIGLVITYSTRFWVKTNKNIEDFTKLGLVVFGLPAYVFRLLHLRFDDYLTAIAFCFLVLWILLSAYREYFLIEGDSKE